MRDRISDYSKIEQFVSDAKASVIRLETALHNMNLNQERIEDIKWPMYYSSFRITIALYSGGASKVDVQTFLLNTINKFDQGFKWQGFEKTYGGYDEMIWMISLCILCDIEIDDFRKVTEIIKKYNVEDSLLNFLIKSKQPDWNQYDGYIIQKSPYAKLENLIKETDAVRGIALLKQYLQKEWYKGHKDAAWHDSHKNNKVNCYFGYWAWETGAIVKAKGWDDNELKELPYYPYDAVHW